MYINAAFFKLNNSSAVAWSENRWAQSFGIGVLVCKWGWHTFWSQLGKKKEIKDCDPLRNLGLLLLQLDLSGQTSAFRKAPDKKNPLNLHFPISFSAQFWWQRGLSFLFQLPTTLAPDFYIQMELVGYLLIILKSKINLIKLKKNKIPLFLTYIVQISALKEEKTILLLPAFIRTVFRIISKKRFISK